MVESGRLGWGLWTGERQQDPPFVVWVGGGGGGIRTLQPLVPKSSLVWEKQVTNPWGGRNALKGKKKSKAIPISSNVCGKGAIETRGRNLDSTLEGSTQKRGWNFCTA